MDHFLSLFSLSAFSLAGVLKLIQIGFIDVVLSGDNAVVIGTVVAGLAVAQRKKALAVGMIIACALRIVFSLGVVILESIPGIVIIGAAALGYVAYKMLKDILEPSDPDELAPAKSFGGALVAICLADLSMSLDNVLGVAGAAGGHWEALVFGLILSVFLMAVAANAVAALIGRFAWIQWIGLALIVFVAGKMLYQGIPDLSAYLTAHNAWLNAHHLGFVSTPMILAAMVVLIGIGVGINKLGLRHRQVIDKTA